MKTGGESPVSALPFSSPAEAGGSGAPSSLLLSPGSRYDVVGPWLSGQGAITFNHPASLSGNASTTSRRSHHPIGTQAAPPPSPAQPADWGVGVVGCCGWVDARGFGVWRLAFGGRLVMR